jgi:hypothetical protein
MKTFDAERLAFYDNEQHLKARIQGLIQVRMNNKRGAAVSEPEEPSRAASPSDASPSLAPAAATVSSTDGDEPAEMTSLRLELSMLSTSHASLQSTVHLLQQQLVELRRVNQELQEENESYAVLLRERTLNGQFDLTKHAGVSMSSSSATTSTSVSASVSEDDADSFVTPSGSLSQGEENAELAHGRFPSRNGATRRSPASSVSSSSRARDTSHGESLADLPITGPGLDLAAELGRAENRDRQGGGEGVEDDDVRVEGAGRKRSAKRSHKKPATSEPPSDIDALRNEVKSLKDANKALSLYASKIIDRIISQQGFEHVLSVDYDKQQRSGATTNRAPLPPPPPPSPAPAKSTLSALPPKKPPLNKSSEIGSDTTSPPPPVKRPPTSKRNSFLSMFGGGGTNSSSSSSGLEKKLRPLTLSPGSTTVGIVNARKLETQEDEEDRRERNRLHATMQLMGLQPPSTPSPPATAVLRIPTLPDLSPSPRFSFFRKPSTSSNGAETPPLPPSRAMDDTHGGRLTRDALERVEMESKLAALDDRERVLGSVFATGAGGGFTEIEPRDAEGMRARQFAIEKGSGSESGSTVWSADAEEQLHSS